MDTIEIEEIDQRDRTLCVSYPLEDALLAASVRTFGIRTPLILLDSVPYRVVTGFKRLAIAIQLQHTMLPCVILRVDRKEGLLTAINDNLSRPTNLVERALSLEKMAAMGFSQDEVFGMMKLLGLEPHDKVLTTLRGLAGAEPFVWDFVVAHGVNLTTVELLLAFDTATRKSLIQLLSSIRPTVSQIREILQLLMLARLKDRDFSLEELAKSSTADEMKLLLKKRTHPVLSGLEERLNELKAEAALPPQIRLKVDPFFEKESIGIDITARDPSEVDEALRKMNRLLEDGFFGSIFELTKGRSGN
jgi:ParB-like chromosome segregation protein Spo0J